VILTLQPEFAASGSASPGCCYFCHAAKRLGDPGIIDYHMQVDVASFDGTSIDGWLQSCVACGEEIGSLVGMANAATVSRLRAELELECSRRLEAEADSDAAERALDALKIHVSRRRPDAEGV
jgi:hypothetical protein